MKHLMTLIALVVAVTAGAQSYPWNPDSDSNGLINFADLLEFLAIYGNEFVLEELPCDIDGDTLFAAAYSAGSKSYIDCVKSCRLNNAIIPDLDLFALFADSLILSLGNEINSEEWWSCDSPNWEPSINRRFWLRYNYPASVYAPTWECEWKYDCDQSAWTGVRRSQSRLQVNAAYINGAMEYFNDGVIIPADPVMHQCVCVGLIDATYVE